MNILIEIECNTISELQQHLEELQRQIMKQVRINHQTINDDFATGTQFYDKDEYGTHELNVIEKV